MCFVDYHVYMSNFRSEDEETEETDVLTVLPNDGVDRTRIWRPGWFFSRDLAAVPLFRRTGVRMRSLERRNIQYKPCRFEFRYTKRVPAPWPKAVSRDTCRLMWDILACCVFALVVTNYPSRNTEKKFWLKMDESEFSG